MEPDSKLKQRVEQRACRREVVVVECLTDGDSHCAPPLPTRPPICHQWSVSARGIGLATQYPGDVCSREIESLAVVLRDNTAESFI
jgi:hypothetical protein